MTGQDVVDLARSEVNEPVAGFWTDAEFLKWINAGERDFANQIRGFERVATFNTVAGRANYPLPANWISAKLIMYNDPNTDGTPNWRRLWPTTLEKTAQEQPNFLSTDAAVRGTPKTYWIWDKEIYLQQPPETTGDEVKMFFKAKAVPLSALTESINMDDSLSDGLVAYVLYRAWKKEQEHEEAAEQYLKYQHYVGLGRRWVKKQSGDLRHMLDISSASPVGGRLFDNDTNPLT